ncbi:hypothetical protein [Saccharolobus islandicus]|uniref:hypothetical protein n=1 Tax=Saccharolobus islandicus TaxID=43080 RepID=UPI000AED71B4|nr:hypothetical protein [Sulfolobus islandicus]
MCAKHNSGSYLIILNRKDGNVVGVFSESHVYGVVVLAEMYISSKYTLLFLPQIIIIP